MDCAKESKLVQWAEEHPELAARTGVRAEVFTHKTRRERWDAVVKTGETFTEGALDDAAYDEVREDLEEVVALHEERTLYPGAVVWEEHDDELNSLRRVVRKPTMMRYVVHASACGGGVTTSLLLANGVDRVGGSAWGALALILLVCGGVVIASVDHDTLFLDTPTLVVTGGGAWIAAYLCATARHSSADLRAGVVVAVAWAVVFVAMNAMYRLVRGITGMGFGDVLITLATAGVPSVVGGDPLIGFAGVVAAMFVALLWHVPKLLGGSIGKRDAFALGPFLFVGWFVSWGVMRAVGAA